MWTTYLASSWFSSSPSWPLRRPYLSSCSSPDLSRTQCHGQIFNAMMVKVVSRQFESVRVEQNHCQGLQMVRRSYSASQRKHQSLYECKRFPRLSSIGDNGLYIQLPMPLYFRARMSSTPAATYNNPQVLQKSPALLSAQLSEGRRASQHGALTTSIARKPASRRRQRYSGVWRSAIGSSIPMCIVSRHEHFHKTRKAYPGDPCAAVLAKRNLPSGL